MWNSENLTCYTAASETYDKYVDKFYKVLDSFTILEQEKLYDDQF